ncbi:MAG TPA: hypothetical protein VK932_14805, partial [Kofleriaceae bacterium]|nr:hypothetical protein [Kofleriaceae bacterium]
MSRVLVLLAAIAAAACYAPSPQPGSPCDGDTPCPSGLVCSAATRRCELPGGGGPDGGGGDGGGDKDAEPPPLCYGTGLLTLCLDAAPQQPVLMNGGTINTDTSPACAPYDGQGLCVIAGTGISLSGVVRAAGSRPLVLVSAAEIFVTGTIDAASRRIGTSAMSPGAGATTGLPACGGAMMPALKA